MSKLQNVAQIAKYPNIIVLGYTFQEHNWRIDKNKAGTLFGIDMIGSQTAIKNAMSDMKNTTEILYLQTRENVRYSMALPSKDISSQTFITRTYATERLMHCIALFEFDCGKIKLDKTGYFNVLKSKNVANTTEKIIENLVEYVIRLPVYPGWGDTIVREAISGSEKLIAPNVGVGTLNSLRIRAAQYTWESFIVKLVRSKKLTIR